MKDQDEIICNCLQVYKSTIVEAIKEKDLTNIQDVADETQAGTGCGNCHDDIQEIINELK